MRRAARKEGSRWGLGWLGSTALCLDMYLFIFVVDDCLGIHCDELRSWTVWGLGEREKAEVPGVPERVQAESKSSKAEERGRKNQKFNEGTVRRHRAKRFPVLYLHLSLLISFASFTRTGTGSGVI